VNPSDVQITAGLGGFLVLFGLALVVWFLGRDLSRRLRRMRHAESDRLQAEAAEATFPAPGQGAADLAETDTRTDPSTGPIRPADPPVSPPRP